MRAVQQCPLCDSSELENLKEHRFEFPGEDVQKHLLDATHVRLWILFERILKSRNEALFFSTLCRACGFIFTNPRFSEEEMGIKYETIDELGSVKKRFLASPPRRLGQRADRIFRLIESHSPPERETQPNILDYGGASGYNLRPFIEGFECSVLDYERWDLPAGVSYAGQELSDLHESDRFDVILLLHTAEHVVDPRGLLQDVAARLKEQGILYVEVPLGCFHEWRFRTEPLTHINFFSEQSLHHCLQAAGLDVIHTSTAYQWVTHGKMWCVNMIGRRNGGRPSAQPERILSTRRQMSGLRYTFRYLMNPRAIRKVARKLAGRGLAGRTRDSA